MNVLVAYASKHGSTEGIASAIADRMTEIGVTATARSVDDVRGLEGVDAVILGSAIYAGSWRNEAVEFVHRHAEALAERPVWLFSSGPLGEQVQDEEEQPRQLPEIEGIVASVEHRIFFGTLDRTKLGFAERMIMKTVRAADGDFRDWDGIRDWADAIAANLRARLDA
jgi:menaquinone-dependent protoporphyrinogen oxidase